MQQSNVFATLTLGIWALSGPLPLPWLQSTLIWWPGLTYTATMMGLSAGPVTLPPLRPSELVDVIINGKALTDEQIAVLSQIAKLPSSILGSGELEAMEDEYIPELLAESFETCWAECAPYNRNWIDDTIAVGTYYDLKQGIRPPFVYGDSINYVIMRNRRYRSI